jgi:hypothetical protein
MVVHDYNVTSLINPGGTNALAILVTPPAHDCKDLSFCTVDWNPEAPDMNAGLWGKTFLSTTGPVALSDTLPLPSTDSADLTVYVDAVNPTNARATTTIAGTITKAGYKSISVSQTVTLNPNERREVVFDPAGYPQLHVASPALWCPASSAAAHGRTTAGRPSRSSLAAALAESDARQRRHLVQRRRGDEDGRPVLVGAADPLVGHEPGG